MRKLIVLRNAGYTGGVYAGYLSGSENRGFLNRKEKKRLREAAKHLRVELEGLSFRIFCSNIPLVRENAKILAKELGKVQAIASNRLGDVISGFPDFESALSLVQEHANQTDVLVLVVYQALANGFPKFFGKFMPGAFSVHVDRQLAKAEGLIIDLETLRYRFTGTLTTSND